MNWLVHKMFARRSKHGEGETYISSICTALMIIRLSYHAGNDRTGSANNVTYCMQCNMNVSTRKRTRRRDEGQEESIGDFLLLSLGIFVNLEGGWKVSMWVII